MHGKKENKLPTKTHFLYKKNSDNDLPPLQILFVNLKNALSSQLFET